ncbi:MAG: hypothetical protein JJLCMIEE_03408 [Acidimicrobiales bacterium]|nr:MAG: hypothetical protein EDR02_18145 [Actinomycetota bacterium]MBV6510271.1 hypothetical protein [Acidimicrobiales bacterium]
MRFRLGLAVGFGVGYYLGAKAGRERYEQIERVIGNVRHRPEVEELLDRLRLAVRDRIDEARGRIEGGDGQTRKSLVIDLRDQISGTSGHQTG